MNPDVVDGLHQLGILSSLDVEFARLVERLSGTSSEPLALAAALTSSRTRQGDVCLDLQAISGKEFASSDGQLIAPEYEPWIVALRNGPMPLKPHGFSPLVLDEAGRLYLYRYWQYESELIRLLNTLATQSLPANQFGGLADRLDELFPKQSGIDIDWQRVSALVALTRKLCVITGGPGTGKTRTVARILALLLEFGVVTPDRVALIAPTGKAASRLQEAIKMATLDLACPTDVRESIPTDASTIHRLLGYSPGSPLFRHNADNRLPHEVVVVDEASMVDIALMSKLVQALPEGARLILLGDRDQLASVEAGAVLGDICDTGNAHGFSPEAVATLHSVTGYNILTGPETDPPGIRDCIVQLRHSYRFGPDSHIGALCAAVNAGDEPSTFQILASPVAQSVSLAALPSPHALGQSLHQLVVEGLTEYVKASNIQERSAAFDRFRILCALRHGPYGVETVNSLVESILRSAGLITERREWYPGRPVLVTENDYNLRLFNGDVGFAVKDPEADGEVRVMFPAPDATVRRFHPLRLPAHETIFAMTVHKSQGSEFDRVLVILPDRDSPILTRELLYTALSRARKEVLIWSPEPVLRTAIGRRISRSSGLRDGLWAS